ncbi:MAG: cysteine--tRNA ligase [Patescibacteria group bacterium]
MFFFKKKLKSTIQVFNTASKQKEPFMALKEGQVKMYTCGPTVYDYVHLGNLRSYVFSDIVRRTFEYAGYTVRQIINITDFGHLVGDADDTEDKMTLALKREGKELTMENMARLADTYIASFKTDLSEMNIKPPLAMPRASEHVGGMRAYVEMLLHKGFAYKTSDGVYFDTSRFPQYGGLGGSSSVDHSRTGVSVEKKNPRDFALWKFNAELGWDAPWGKGFPGWHIECTAMSTHYLGKTFDIHTGGIDHIAVHHNNELAQAEAANDKPYVKYWLHHEFVTVDALRIGKSEGNAITLTQLKDRGIHPLAYRYWLLGAHYKQKINFTWEAVQACQTALHRAWKIYADLQGRGSVDSRYRTRFEEAIYDDFNTPQAVAVLWDLLKDETIPGADKRATVLMIDSVLGIGFGSAHSRSKTTLHVVETTPVPEAVQALISEREAARKEKNFALSDKLREDIQKEGFTILDGPTGPVVKKTSS